MCGEVAVSCASQLSTSVVFWNVNRRADPSLCGSGRCQGAIETQSCAEVRFRPGGMLPWEIGTASRNPGLRIEGDLGPFLQAVVGLLEWRPEDGFLIRAQLEVYKQWAHVVLAGR